MSSGCLRSVCSPACLGEVQAATGAQLFPNRPLSCVNVIGAPAAVEAAVAQLKARVAGWTEKRAFVPVEEFMLPRIVGKNGSIIAALEKQHDVKLAVNRSERRLEIEGRDREVVIAASRALTVVVEELRNEHWQTVVDAPLIGALLGKQGAHIKKLRAESLANFNMDARTNTLTVGWWCTFAISSLLDIFAFLYVCMYAFACIFVV
jgi:hypothetical protein